MLGTCLLSPKKKSCIWAIWPELHSLTRRLPVCRAIFERHRQKSINKVQEVATDDVEPTANPIPLEAYLRPDVPETPLTQEEATAGAPVSEAGMFVAPRILGEE